MQNEKSIADRTVKRISISSDISSSACFKLWFRKLVRRNINEKISRHDSLH